MILRAISSLMATRDSFTLTMMLPPRADTTVMDPPAVLFYLGISADPADHVFFTDICQCKRHHNDPSESVSSIELTIMEKE